VLEDVSNGFGMRPIVTAVSPGSLCESPKIAIDLIPWKSLGRSRGIPSERPMSEWPTIRPEWQPVPGANSKGDNRAHVCIARGLAYQPKA